MYFPAIGLEIHLQLATETKMFCDCPNAPEENQANKNICPICLGHPGVLPVPNKKAIEYTLQAGLALNCQIRGFSKFDRKNYFYPDLPKNYQISQYDLPFCEKGFLDLPNSSRVRITRIHLEEDTGRLIHQGGYSLIDFNRAGLPLLELVTEPDLNSGQEASIFAKELQLIFRYLGISEADMEKGQLRVEANISLSNSPRIKPNGSRIVGNNSGSFVENSRNSLGTKVEIKNLNSFKAVRDAIDYEIKRQSRVLSSGKKVIQQTRGWNEDQKATFPQRQKEEAQDYRYFPEPDIPPLRFGTKNKKQKTINNKNFIDLEKIKAGLPELPQARRQRFKREYRLSEDDIEVLVQNKDLGEYFEKVASELKAWLKVTKDEAHFLKCLRLTANYLITELQKLMNEQAIGFSRLKVTPENFAEFVKIIHQAQVSSTGAQKLLAQMFKTGADPSHILKEQGLEQISDKAQLEKIVEKVISQNKKPVSDFLAGKTQALKFLIGKVMAETRGRANPCLASKILKQKLKS